MFAPLSAKHISNIFTVKDLQNIKYYLNGRCSSCHLSNIIIVKAGLCIFTGLCATETYQLRHTNQKQLRQNSRLLTMRFTFVVFGEISETAFGLFAMKYGTHIFPSGWIVFWWSTGSSSSTHHQVKIKFLWLNTCRTDVLISLSRALFSANG